MAARAGTDGGGLRVVTVDADAKPLRPGGAALSKAKH